MNYSIDKIINTIEYSKLFTNKSNIGINKKLPDFNLIIKFLDVCDIPYKVYETVKVPERFDLHFGKEIEFRDLFIVTKILMLFGIDAICYENEKSNFIYIGSYARSNPSSKFLTADELLQISKDTSLKDALQIGWKIKIHEEFNLNDAMEYGKLFNNKTIPIYLNKFLKDYKPISNLFNECGIKLQQKESHYKKPELIGLYFTGEIGFKSLYIITKMLSPFGLQKVYYQHALRFNAKAIHIGTNLNCLPSHYNISDLETYINMPDYSVTVDDLLKIPMDTDMNQVKKELWEVSIEESQRKAGSFLRKRSPKNYLRKDDDFFTHADRTYEDYNGYNDYTDQQINDIFDGDSSLTWNID